MVLKLKAKIFSLVAVFSMAITIIPFGNAFAYSGGLLHGKPLNRGFDENSISNISYAATDGNESSYDTLYYSGGLDTLWYSFSSPVTIGSYRLKATSYVYIKVVKSDSTVVTITSNPDISGSTVNFTPITDVKKVFLYNGSGGYPSVYEFDVFAPKLDTTAPDEVTNLQTSVTDTTIDLTFTNPTDADFAGTKLYLNGVLKATLDKTKTSYSFANLAPNTLYTIKVATFDTSGNESTGVTTTVKTKVPLVEDVTDLQADAKYDRIKLSWTRPDSEFFSHVKIYRKKIEQQSFWNQLFGATSVSAATTSDGYTPVFETNGTYWTDLTVTPDTTYSYKVTSVNTEGNESQGVTIETTTPSEPVPILTGVATTQNQNGDYVVTWTSPTKGKVKVIIAGKEYKVVDAATQQVIIPKEDMKTNFFGGYEAQLLPIGEFGTEGEAVQVPAIEENQLDFPLSFKDFLETVISILTWAAPFILLSFVFIFWRPIIEFIKKMLANAKGGRVKQ